MGAVHLRLANMEEARRFLQEAYEHCLKGGGAYLILASLGHLGNIASQTEGLASARHHLESSLQLAREQGLTGVPAFAIILYQLAQVHYLAYELEEAREYLLPAMELSRGERETDIHANVLIHLARVAAAEGAHDEADRHLTAASALALRHNVKPFATTLDVERARLDEARIGRLQDPEDAPPSAETSDSWTTWKEAETVLQLQHCLRSGRHDEARKLAEILKEESEPRHRGPALVVAEMARGALAPDAARRKEILSEALSLAATRGYVMPLILGGPPIRAVLNAALKYPLPSHAQVFVRDQVLPRMPASESGPAPRLSQDDEWDLSEREAEVLTLLAKGQTNAEMAKTLFVSVNTVKTHLKNIFSKLGVRNRTEAVQVAERRGILPNPPRITPGLTRSGDAAPHPIPLTWLRGTEYGVPRIGSRTMGHENHQDRNGESGRLYQVEVRGHIAPNRRGWFGAEWVSHHGPLTVLRLRVADQSDLYGRLRRIHDLNLHLVSIRELDEGRSPNAAGEGEP
jgi:LuxR family maltose regulon positive regulatory protein